MTSSIVTAPLSSLTGVIERITFHSEESGYTVARLNTGNVKQLITIVGSFANIQAGQTLQIQGEWREHPQYGRRRRDESRRGHQQHLPQVRLVVRKCCAYA